MTWILWLNTIAETVIAFGMFSAPASFFPGAEGVGIPIARAFSFAILAVAFISLSVSGKNTTKEARLKVVSILAVYHGLQLIAQFVNGALHPPMLVPPVVIHSVFTPLFIVYLIKLRQPQSA